MCTCASRPSGIIRATNRESGEWMSGGGQQLHASHRYNTASSASSAASASPAAFRDGRTDRLLPCDISVGVCPSILSKLMPYHAGLFHEGVGLGWFGSGSVWVWQPRASWVQGCGCVDRTSASTFPRQNFPRTALACHQRRLFWAAASPRCDRCKLSRLAMQLTGRLMQAPSLLAPRLFHNFNHLFEC